MSDKPRTVVFGTAEHTAGMDGLDRMHWAQVLDGLTHENKWLRAESERLRAALSWVREVYPGRNKESDGAIVHITWDQWNAMREVIGLKPQPLPPRSSQSVRIIRSRAPEGK